ncbi:MAG: hypothetical protein H8E44_44680 [Planctomycetes bacterium]|nr:hypothetical protein [Planctomycetota bacterium]MBL7038249.1 hypothetical protein [Pirellulaceae bacterium]
MHDKRNDAGRVNHRRLFHQSTADSRPVLLAFLVLCLQIGLPLGVCSENEAAKETNGAGEPQAVEARAFDEFSVEFRGIWMWWEKARLAVKGDGAVECSMSKAPNDDSRYTAEFRLSPKHLDQLVQLLKETGWLTKPGANVQPNYTDATQIDMKLIREGKAQKAWCHDRNPEPYFSLVRFLKRLQRQEFLLNRAVAAGQEERIFAFRELDQGIRSARGDSVAAPAFSPLDYSRFIPVSMDAIMHPDENHEETIVTALRLLAMLETEKARQQITKLTTAKQVGRAHVSPKHRAGMIGSAAVEALTTFGGPQVRQHIREMAKDHGSWERRVNEALVEGLLALDRGDCAGLLKNMVSSTKEAAWGLIRLGPTGVPVMLELLEERDRRNMGQIHLIRQYIDHWEELPGPTDDRVIEAVRKNLDFRLGSSRDWTQYHQELLKLAGAPGLPDSCPRQIADAFLTSLKEDDRTTFGVTTLADMDDWSEWHGKLKKLPEFQKLAIAEVYADKNDNMALATAVNPDGKKGGQLAIYLNFCSGAVWRVSTLFIHTPEESEKSDRVFKRFLQKHPDAKLVPGK